MKQRITVPCTPHEAEELQRVLTEFLADYDFFLAEGQDRDEARRLRQQRQPANHWSAKLLVAQALAPEPRLKKKCRPC